MSDEPRRSVRATKGQHTKSLDLLDQPEPTKKRGGKKAAAKKVEAHEQSQEVEEDVIRCVCGTTEQDDEAEEDWIACMTCDAWQHNVCMGITTEKSELETMDYWCEQCKPENHKELLDALARGEKLWETRRREHELAMQEAQKGKKGKKGKAKRASDHKTDAAQNGKAKSPEALLEVKKEKKEAVSRAGSTKRKTRDEDSSHDDSKTKIRKVSTAHSSPSPQDGNAPADLAAAIGDLDKGRQGAATMIHKSVVSVMKDKRHAGTFQGSDAELQARALRLALHIERSTYDISLSKTTYGQQARRLAANLKGNPELVDRLLARTLSPAVLATMNDDELASKELQRQTAEMKARAEKQSIMINDDGPRIRRTHKGDEIIEADNYAATSEEMPVARRRSMLDPNAGMGDRSREQSPEGPSELPMDIDDYPSQDNIRENATASQPLSIDTRATSPIRKPSGAVSNFDINAVLSKVSPTTPHPVRKPSGHAAPPSGPGEDADVDRLLDDGNESPPYSPPQYDSDPSTVWRGSLHMASIGNNFPVSAKWVAGADLSNLLADAIPWSDLIPDKLVVAGRIDPDKANEYLCSLRYSPNTDLSVVALTPAGGHAVDEFKKVFEYFQTKSRYGVIGNKNYAGVRDTYLIPVPAGNDNGPEFLSNLEDNKFPTERTENIMIVAVVVRSDMPSQPDLSRTLQESASNSPTLLNHPQLQMSLSRAGPSMSPIAPQGGFPSPHPATPGQVLPQAGNLNSQNEVQRRQREEDQRRGETTAVEILGPYANAPSAIFLMPQAWRMTPIEWQVVREIYDQAPASQEDVPLLSKLLAERKAPGETA